MSKSNISAFPNWKNDATVAERLFELAGLAAEFPERFSRFVICYREELPNGNFKYRTMQHGCDTDQMVGMFEIGKNDAMKDCER